jgi:hypothetical protein
MEEPIVEEMVAEEPIVEEVVAEEPMVEEPIVEEPTIEAPVVEAAAVIEEIEAEPAVDAVEEAAVSQDLHCSVCGAVVLADQVFCASCGAALQAVEEEVQVEPEVVSIGPYLEVVQSGAHIPLVVQPELLVGRLDEVSGINPEVDMTPHGGFDAGVSRRHAKLLYEGNAWFVVDLDSTNGTLLNGTELAPRTRVALSDGDKLEFGEVEVIFNAG